MAPMIPDDDFQRRRRHRNIVVGLVLGALVLLFYAITVARMQG